jgi:hypothetical protein
MKLIIFFYLIFYFHHTFAQDNRFIVEYQNPLTDEQLKKIKALETINHIEQPVFFTTSYLKKIYFIDSPLSTLKGKHFPSNLRPSIIETSKEIDFFSFDPMSFYQWHFNNRGQVFYRDQYIFKTEGVKTKSGEGLNQKEIFDYLEGKEFRQVKVAVIDTGVDFFHPDLKQAILKNPKECTPEGNIKFEPSTDEDGNGLIGDCLGWNFAASSAQEARTPIDRHGHGTHISGIIAAQNGNGLGVSSLALNNRIKILPIKVNNDPDYVTPTIEVRSRRGKRLISRSDVFLKALAYAIDRKVDVINLSIGWNKINDNQLLRRAVQDAYRQGITIVAAAGNSRSNDPIYPCSYPEVICVGALNNQGEIAHFSNYGGHVDLFAPGEFILSTFPSQTANLNFAIRGYEVMSGTSQATPLVSSAVALIKSVTPRINPNFLEYKLFSSSKKREELKTFARFGELDILKALSFNEGNQAFYAPNLKLTSLGLYSPQTGDLNFSLYLKNLSLSKEPVDLKITFQTDALSIQQDTFGSQMIPPGKTKKIDIKAKILNRFANFKQPLNITLTHKESGKVQTFQHELKIGQAILNNEKLRKFPIELNTEQLLTTKQNNIIKTVITAVPSIYEQKEQEFYFQKREDGKLKSINLLRPDGRTFKELKPILLEDTERVLAFFQYDANYDRELDYFLLLIKRTETERYFEIKILNKDLVSYFTKAITYPFNRLKLDKLTAQFSHGDISGLEQLGLMPTDIQGQKIALPYFIVPDAIVPRAQQIIDDFSPISYQTADRIFFQQVDKVDEERIHLKQATLLDLTDITEIKTAHNHFFQDQLLDTVMLPQNQYDFYQGKIRFILNIGRGLFVKSYLVSKIGTARPEVSPLQQSIKLNDRAFFIQPGDETPIIATAQTRLRNQIAIDYYQFASNAQGSIEQKSFVWNNKEFKNPRLLAFKTEGNRSKSYILGQNQLGLIDSEGEIISQAKIKKYSFIPPKLFYLLHQPVQVQTPNGQTMGILRNGTELTDSTVQVFAPIQGQLLAPIAGSLKLPSGCKALTPKLVGKLSYYRQICQTGPKKWELHFLPLTF